MSQQNIQVVRRLFEAVDQRNLAGVRAVYDPEIAIREGERPTRGDVDDGHRGPGNVALAWSDFQTPGEEIESAVFLDAAEYVVVLWRQKGLYGRSGKLDLPVAGVYRMRSNKIVESQVLCREAFDITGVDTHGAVHPARDDKEAVLAGISGAAQDITERKKAESEREALIRELEARNAQLERFTHAVSHDLKSPLITIRGFLSHIEAAAIEGRLDAVKADMGRVYRAAEKMDRLLDDLLELSRGFPPRSRLAQPLPGLSPQVPPSALGRPQAHE